MTVDAPKTLMTDEQAFHWAWRDLISDLNTEHWTAGDEGEILAFFKCGWGRRAQLDPASSLSNEQAFNASWEDVKKNLKPMNVGESVQMWAFFKYGWDYRAQLERQR